MSSKTKHFLFVGTWLSHRFQLSHGDRDQEAGPAMASGIGGHGECMLILEICIV